MEWVSENRLRSVLLVITLGMTAQFGIGLSAGVTGFVFALVLVTIQAAALLHLPDKLQTAKENHSLLGVCLYGGSIVTALLVSVTASVATLSAYEDAALQSHQKRIALEQAVTGYMEAGYVTKALTVQEDLDALPISQPTGLQSAAQRLETLTGVDGMVTISIFVIMLALMLDGYVLMLREPVTPVTETVTQPETDTMRVDKVSQPPLPAPQLPAELQDVFVAVQAGQIESASVRNVRQLLSCSQQRAVEIARLCRQAQLELEV